MKLKHLTFYLALALAGILQSCSVATTVHFNKDFSGTYQTVLDMSGLISMAGMADTTGTMDQSQMVEQMRLSIDSLELADAYNSVSGIRDAVVDVSDDGVISIGFMFDNVESLNASFKSVQEKTTQKMGNQDSGSMDMLPTDFLGGGDQMFKRNGKSISHSLNSEGLGLGAMIDYTIDFSFDRKVKSVDVDGLSILEQSSHMVKTRVDFPNLIKEGKYSIVVNTK
jgi:hypothetical protein